MKIKSLHISAFGGIKNLDLNLNDSFNIVYGDNENGKTTIMNFIKMMFYGTERSGAQLNKNLRKKYTPWDNSQMAGSIVFENGNRLYRLERIFGNSNSTDKITLYNLDFGTSEAASADIGTKLFGLTLPAFERSIFIGQFGFPDSNDLAAGELNGKLSNIALTGDETVSFDAVNKKLEDAKYELMSKSGKKGLYDKNLKLCESLEKELEKQEQIQQIVENANIKLSQIAEKIKAMQAEANALKQQIDSENDFRNSEKLKELLRLKEELDKLNLQLALNDGTLADEMFVRKVEFCLSKIEKIKDKITAKQNENRLLENNLNLALNAGNATPQKAEELTKKINSLEKEKQALSEKIALLGQQKPKKSATLWFVLAMVFAILGAAGYFINQAVAICGFAIAVILVCIAIIIASKSKSKAAKAQSMLLDLKLKENGLMSVIAAENANLTAITAALNSGTAMIENQKEMLHNNNKEIEALTLDKENEKQILFNLFSVFKPSETLEEISTLLEGIKQTATAQKELKQNINYILKDVGNLSYEEIKERLGSLQIAPQIDFEKAKHEYENLLQTLTNLKTQAATILAETKSLSANAKNPDDIKAELENLKQKTSAQKEYCDAIDIALSVLADSYAEVRKKYGSVLEKKASGIFSAITNENYHDMSISKSFDISVEKTNIFGTKELDYLSSGTVDQAYLSLRLALSDLISQESQALPIILDDALAQYDDTRTEIALKFLKEYSAKGQIILFTCHKAITTIAEGLQANNITL